MNHIQRALVGIGAVVLSTAAIAHHGWSGYETDIRKMSGTIEQASYANPHSSIRLKTADKTWVIVLAPPSRMSNRGITADMLKVGKNVSVEGYVHKTDTSEMRAERITLDGKTVELR
jgi:hypothetical protein